MYYFILVCFTLQLMCVSITAEARDRVFPIPESSSTLSQYLNNYWISFSSHALTSQQSYFQITHTIFITPYLFNNWLRPKPSLTSAFYCILFIFPSYRTLQFLVSWSAFLRCIVTIAASLKKRRGLKSTENKH